MTKKYTESVQEILETYTIWLYRQPNFRLAKLHEALALCESPPEQMLLMALLQQHDARPLFGVERFFGKAYGDADYYADISVIVSPQRYVIINKHVYRVDIMLSIEYGPGSFWDALGYVTLPDGIKVLHQHPSSEDILNLDAYPISHIAVEVDGHDFHERTKAQARRDKQRDRMMQMVGITVLRYTASEVVADAYKVAEDINEFVLKEARRRARPQ